MNASGFVRQGASAPSVCMSSARPFKWYCWRCLARVKTFGNDPPIHPAPAGRTEPIDESAEPPVCRSRGAPQRLIELEPPLELAPDDALVEGALRDQLVVQDALGTLLAATVEPALKLDLAR